MSPFLACLRHEPFVVRIVIERTGNGNAETAKHRNEARIRRAARLGSRRAPAARRARALAPPRARRIRALAPSRTSGSGSCAYIPVRFLRKNWTLGSVEPRFYHRKFERLELLARYTRSYARRSGASSQAGPLEGPSPPKTVVRGSQSPIFLQVRNFFVRPRSSAHRMAGTRSGVRRRRSAVRPFLDSLRFACIAFIP